MTATDLMPSGRRAEPIVRRFPLVPSPGWLSGRGRARGDSERLWQQVSQRIGRTAFSESRVLLVGFDHATLSPLREALRGLGVQLAAACSDTGQIGDISGMGSSFNVVMANLDAFDGPDVAVDILHAFRRSNPDTVVILVSAQVAADDLTSERAPICDATLRIPVSASRLRSALGAAITNRLETQAA